MQRAPTFSTLVQQAQDFVSSTAFTLETRAKHQQTEKLRAN